MATDRVVCLCTGVTANEIREAIRRGASSISDIARALHGTGLSCEVCHGLIDELLREARGEPPADDEPDVVID